MKKLINKYGLANAVISIICCVVFILNCLFITKDALLNINDNIFVAYLLNFLAGCEGVLGKWGSMSYSMAIEKLQLWRVVTQAYLHGGIFHLGFNLAALLVIGKNVEKKFGSATYIMVYHLITIIDAVIVSFIFTSSVFVGASGGIFGVIGIALIMCIKKQLKFKKSELIFLISFSVIANVPAIYAIDTLLTHVFGLVLGVISGMVLLRQNTSIELTY
ncbi:MAG: rhomboid family intramembrane serine protease [Saccharofermentans sp.]|nr:rhomboid family intramembrane serine protease [Saccharofermentans sp.]